MGLFLTILIVSLIVLGAISYFAEQRAGDDDAPERLSLLPGDIKVERGNFKFFFPITTSIVLSIVLTLVMRLFG